MVIEPVHCGSSSILKVRFLGHPVFLIAILTIPSSQPTLTNEFCHLAPQGLRVVAEDGKDGGGVDRALVLRKEVDQRLSRLGEEVNIKYGGFLNP